MATRRAAINAAHRRQALLRRSGAPARELRAL